MGKEIEEPEVFSDLAPLVEAWWHLTSGHPPVPVEGALAYRRDMPVLMETPPDEYLHLLRAADRAAAEFHKNQTPKAIK